MDHMPATPLAILSAANPDSIPAGFVEGVWHPEDLVRLAGTPWIVVSAMRSIGGKGALLAVLDDGRTDAAQIAWAASAETGRVSAAAFDPHGIDVRRLGGDRFELLVVDHGDGEAIDRLTIDTSTDRPLSLPANGSNNRRGRRAMPSHSCQMAGS